MSRKVQHVQEGMESKIQEQTHKISQQLKDTEKAKKKAVKLLKDVKQERNNVTTEKAKMEAILASIGYGVVAVDREQKVFLMNKSAEELL